MKRMAGMAYLRLTINALITYLLALNIAFAVPDQEINMNIIYQWARYPDTLTMNIETYTHDGIVSLRGEVDNLREAKGAICVAARTVGVKDVLTRRLTLPFGKPIPVDDVITTKIECSMQRENLATTLICYEVKDRVVYLTDNLPTHKEKRRLQKMILAMPEVKRIAPLQGVECGPCGSPPGSGVARRVQPIFKH